MRLVRPAITERIAGAGRLATQLEAGKARFVTDVSRIELIDRNVDANGILRLIRLSTSQKARRTLAMAAALTIAVRERGIVGQTGKAVEVFSGK